MKNVVRKKIAALPNLAKGEGVGNIPELAGADYLSRVRQAQKRMGEYTHLLLYGDREHFSNIEYFTGFDPRFEEALLIIPREGVPSIIVGNEGSDYANMIGYELRKFVYPPFSLPGQPRNDVRPLDSMLRSAGLTETCKIGVIGWKLFSPEDGLDAEKSFDVPFFIMESMLKVAPLSNLSNAIELMIGLDSGMRIINDLKELLLSEIAGTLTSRNVYRVLQNLREGMTEIEASEYLKISGMPLSVHSNVNFGKNLSYGLASPTAGTKLKRGDVVGIGMAYRRTLCHKVGYFVESAAEEPETRKAFYDTYFRAISAWYQALKIGATGETVYEAVRNETGDLSQFGIGLNPGHLIHTDEWTNTPFWPGCKSRLSSGMMVQCDFTAAQAGRDLIAHAEDGVLLADEATRKKIREASPAAWRRIQERRDFMIGQLGIMLCDEVLPTSDLPGVIFPYLCDTDTVVAFG